MNEVINDLLGYEGLKIIQRPDMFNFSLDSTILGYYVTVTTGIKKICDLGCGNGYIPLFLSLRTKAKIDGVEIQEEVCSLAERSVELNKLNEQIHIYNLDLKEAYKTLGVATYDCVTCNPPFFPYKDSSLINESIYQTIARHEVMCNLDDCCKAANILLKDGGTFAMVHRVDRMVDIFDSLRQHGFEPKRVLFVYPKTNSTEAQTIFIESKKSKNKGNLKILPPLYVYNDQEEYTKDILKIFNYKKED